MSDFADSLDRRLRSLASIAEPVSRLSIVPPVADLPATAAGSPTAGLRRHLRPPTLRRPMFTGSMAAAVCAAATAIVLTGSGASALPILETESSDASALKSNPTLAAVDANFREGFPFSTPDGSGWVLTSRDERTVCVSVPNRADPGSSGAACAPRATVERRGLTLELVSDREYDPRAKNRVAFVLPAGASAVTLTTGGRTIALQTQTGVAVAWLSGPGSIAFRLDGRVEQRSFEGPFDGASYLCRGRPLVLPPTKLGPTSAVRCR
ncbi:MAG: hypothetical protein Q7T55_06265 [Solirubrobacteraceae bacterium]|nr:hypothetical protein [Solirubrobacteraceae bacterium]